MGKEEIRNAVKIRKNNWTIANERSHPTDVSTILKNVLNFYQRSIYSCSIPSPMKSTQPDSSKMGNGQNVLSSACKRKRPRNSSAGRSKHERRCFPHSRTGQRHLLQSRQNRIDCRSCNRIRPERQQNRQRQRILRPLTEKASCPKIGVGYHFQLFDEIPADPHDVPMNAIVTDTDILQIK